MEKSFFYRWYVWPNWITFARIPVSAGIYVALSRGLLVPAAALFLFGAVTDLFDGMAARRYGLVTRFGKFMDPLADKVLTVTTLLVMVRHGIAPINYFWAFFALFFLEALLFRASCRSSQAGANRFGKIKTTLEWILIVFLFLQYWGVALPVLLGDVVLLSALYMAFLSLMGRRQWVHVA